MADQVSAMARPMIPGEVEAGEGDLVLNEGREAVTLMVANTGDRPVQVGSHFHFFEANRALDFDRDAARGMRLDIASGTAVRFEPGQRREVSLVPYAGDRIVHGFRGLVGGALAVLMLLLPEVAGAQEADCASAVTQFDLNECAYAEFEAADAELNRAYAAAVEAAREAEEYEPGAEDRLRAAQRAWVAFRDLDCEAVAPATPGAGSMQPMAYAGCLAGLTDQRAYDLWAYAEAQGY